ncbi:hypothetical protein H0266_13595 [Halobacillus locisalis]|uniref:Lipoprotein n=1 Tax=Halobacillus locisalis TaxID=220753 RepID=A0A838CWD9_9BACI|nr:hypothetical protein [Halobacillus locisalis]MBA2175926.1 hypothetical protein [Halobacillus locisalis]
MKRTIKVIYFAALLIILSACQNQIDLEVEREQDGLRFYEDISIDEALDQLDYDVPLPTTLPFEQGDSRAQIYEHIDNPDRQGVKVRYVKEGVELDYSSKRPMDDIFQYLDYTVAGYETGLKSIKEHEDVEKVMFGDQEVYFSYSPSIPAASLHWARDGKGYSLSYFNAYAREEDPTKEQFEEIMREVYQSIEY